MNTRTVYFAKTRIGTFRIKWERGEWHATFQDEHLGGYPAPQQAVDDLVGGHTFSLSTGHDTSELGLPDEIGEWERSIS